jgi:hypothetical protein
MYLEFFLAVNNILTGNAESLANDPDDTYLLGGDALNMKFIRGFPPFEEDCNFSLLL